MEPTNIVPGNRRTSSKKAQQYSEASNLFMLRPVLLRLPEAEAAVRDNKPFKAVASYLTSQMRGRDYKGVKTKLHKILKPKSSDQKGSLAAIPFMKDILSQTLKGKTLSSDPYCTGKKVIQSDEETEDTLGSSLGKRTPQFRDFFSSECYYDPQKNFKTSVELFGSVCETTHSAEFSETGHLPRASQSIERCFPGSAADDLNEPVDANYFNFLLSHGKLIPEDDQSSDLLPLFQDSGISHVHDYQDFDDRFLKNTNAYEDGFMLPH